MKNQKTSLLATLNPSFIDFKYIWVLEILSSWRLGSVDASPSWNKMLCMICYMLGCKHLHDICDKFDFFSFDFISLLSCFRGMLAKRSKHYFFTGFFWGCSRIGVQKCPLSPASLKSVTYILQWWNLGRLYLTQRRFKTYINHVTHPLGFADITIFSQKISNFCYIKKYRYRLHFNK